ncbi:MAG TPA: ATP-binding protein [Vicinamibacterales bacterium]|nr:ATP-binding protein [Vicinamibacterales bacterium]
MRASTLLTGDLVQSIGTLGEALAADASSGKRPDFGMRIEGRPRPLAPLLRDEVYRIAGEALHNAFRHAPAVRIEVDLRYDPHWFRLRVRDDGRGIDPAMLDRGRAGHYGLAGMRERATLLGGTLAVWSELDSGTEAELTVPASVAYGKANAC